MNLTKKNINFNWNVKCEHAFNNLKKWFMTVLIFTHFDSDFECVFKADLSDHIQKDVLLQYDKNNVLCSVVFFSWKLNAAESNYKIYDKKLLAII
jgi:RNase H-like domain found in reverse transcriptase